MLIDLFNSALTVFIPYLVELYFWIGSMMIGNFVVWGEHWGKVPWSERFQSPMRLFAWLFGFIVLALVVTHFASPLAQDWLSRNVNYLTGITSGVVGTFYVWFFWSGGWILRRGLRWVLPVLCYGVTAFNLLSYHSAGLPISSSDISWAFIGGVVILAVVVVSNLLRPKKRKPW